MGSFRDGVWMKVLHRGCGRSEQVRKAAHRFVILRSLMAATLTFGVLFTSPAERIYAISQPVAAANFQSSSVNTLQTFKSEPAAANQSQPAGQPAAEAAVAEAAAEAPAALPPATESPLATANVLKNNAAETASANTAQPKVRKRRSTALAEIIYFPNPDVLDSLPGYACPPVNPATSTNMSYSNCRCEVPQVDSEREQSGNFAYVLTTQALYKVGLNYNGTVNSKYHLVGYLPYSEYVSPGATGKHDALGINRRTNEVFFAHRSGEGNNIGGANQAVAFYHYDLDELPADKDNLGTYFLQHPQPKFFVENLGVEIDAATVDPSGNYIFGGVNRVADEANARSRGYSAGNEYNTFNFKLFSYNPKTRQVSYLGDIEERAEAVDPNDSYSVRDKHFDLTFDAGGNLYLLSGSSAKKFPGAQLEDQRFMSEYAGGSENTTYDKLYHNTVRMRRVNAADYDTALRNGVSLAQSGYVTNFKNQWTIAAGHARYNENPDIASVFAKPFANLPIDPETGLIRFDSFQNPGDPNAGKIDRDSHPKWTLRGSAANRKEIDSVYVRGFFMGKIIDESKAAGMVLDSSGNLIVSTHDGLGKSVYGGAQENSNSIGVRAFSALTGQRINNGALSFNTSRGPSGVSAGMCDPFNWGGKNAPEPKSNYYRDIFPVLIGDYHQTDMDYGGSLAPVARVKKIIAGERAHTQDQFTVTMKFAGVHNFAQYHMESTHTQGTASESPYSRDLLVTPGNTLIIEEKGTRNGKQFTWANWSQYTSTLKCTHAKGNVNVPALAETVGDKRTWKFQVPENISGIMECQVKNTTEPELQGSITLIKKGENNQPLANAGFTLYRDEDQNGEFSAGDVRISAELLTSDAGIITWNDLQLGAYVAVETKVPAEYRVPTNNNFPVILAKSGTTAHAQIEVQNQRKPPIGNTPGDPAQVCLLTEKTPTYTLTVTNKAKGTDSVLANSVFSLFVDKNADGKVNSGERALLDAQGDTHVTNTAGKTSWQKLPAGDYILQQISAKGHHQAANQAVKITDRNVAIDVLSEPAAQLAKPTNVPEIEVRFHAMSMDAREMLKQYEENKYEGMSTASATKSGINITGLNSRLTNPRAAVPGTTWRITSYDEDKQFKCNGRNVYSCTIRADQQAVGGRAANMAKFWIEPGSYTFTLLNAPGGYANFSSSIRLPNYNYRNSNWAYAWAYLPGGSFNPPAPYVEPKPSTPEPPNWNQPFTVRAVINDVNDATLALPGAQVQLRSKSRNVSVQTAVVNKDGWAEFANVSAGAYTVVQTKAAPGYVLPAERTIGTIADTTAADNRDGVKDGYIYVGTTNTQMNSICWAKYAQEDQAAIEKTYPAVSDFPTNGMKRGLLKGSEWEISRSDGEAFTYALGIGTDGKLDAGARNASTHKLVVVDTPNAAGEKVNPAVDQIATAGIMGLKIEPGDYVITETRAPLGFALPKDPRTKVRVPADNNGYARVFDPRVDIQAPPLPFTGGIAADIFAALGLAVLAIAGTAEIVRRRKAAAFASAGRTHGAELAPQPERRWLKARK